MAGSDHPTASRRAFLLKLVKDPKLPADIRMAVAPKCFPGKLSQARRRRRPGSAEMSEGSHTRNAATQNLNPLTLDAFFGVIQDVTADPKGRRKAALKIAEFLLPKVAKKAKILPDEFGFTVYPNLAARYRDMQLELRSLVNEPTRTVPAIAQKIENLEERADAMRRCLQVPCPSKYDNKQAASDRLRLDEFTGLRDNNVVLAEVQKAEEAHVKVRFDVFATSPESVARRRRETLERLESRFRASRADKGWYAPPLSHKAKSTLRLLRWLYPKPIADDSKHFADHPLNDDELELLRCYNYHPFRDELPATERFFYPKDSKLGPPSATADLLVQTQVEDAVDTSRDFGGVKSRRSGTALGRGAKGSTRRARAVRGQARGASR